MKRLILICCVLAAHAAWAADGQPDVTTPDGGRYYGAVEGGKFQGRGRIEWPNGAAYQGWFEKGLFDGRGRYEAPSGEIYEGDFDKGEFTGQGTYSRPDGARYRGAFLKWRMHGEGRFVDANGDLFEGSFVNGELNGQGKAVSRSGDVYEGEFRQGLFNGKGVLTYARPRPDGSRQVTGIWRNGRLIDDPDRRAAGLAVETALLTQRQLLDSALAALAPGRPGVIDMYFLAVGGDGSQEVFRREAQFVRSQFDERFGTRNRSIALVNSRNTFGSAPMATVSSIGEALKAIAARMNRDEDILFLFLTSHGTREHELALAQNYMTLRDLPARELGRLLKESGIRWKVIVLSACYAGGFIDHLKDDSTMVITAARGDRASFGCADENDFTYFGRAFFKEALPKSRSFQDAFARADALVAEWERKEQPKEERSLPQIHSTPAISAQLARWWATRTNSGSGH
ncbi:MAG TPA: C13 family peptidase [Burkholderiales bacterium]